jgi:uncharacterized protein (DUF885 family)
MRIERVRSRLLLSIRAAKRAALTGGILFTSRAIEKVKFAVYPAHREVSGVVTGLLDSAPRDSGIWVQPDGETFYSRAIRQLGNSDRSAEDIHRLGMAEIERISAEMDLLLRGRLFGGQCRRADGSPGRGVTGV